VSDAVGSERLDTPERNPDFIRLQVEVEQLRERLTETQEQRDKWQAQAMQLALPKPEAEIAGQGSETRWVLWPFKKVKP
jgi:hypothetical protein